MQVFTHVHRCMYTRPGKKDTVYTIHASFVYSVLVFVLLRELILLNRLDCPSSLDFLQCCNVTML